MVTFLLSFSLFFLIIIPLWLIKIDEISIRKNKNMNILKKIFLFWKYNFLFFLIFFMFWFINFIYDWFISFINFLLFLWVIIFYLISFKKDDIINIFDIKISLLKKIDIKGILQYSIYFLIFYSLYYFYINYNINVIYWTEITLNKLIIAWPFIIPLLLGISYIDKKYQLIPDTLIYMLLILSSIIILNNINIFIYDIPFALLCFSLILIITWIIEKITKKEIIWYQDPLILIILSIILWFPIIILFWFVFFITTLISKIKWNTWETALFQFVPEVLICLLLFNFIVS